MSNIFQEDPIPKYPDFDHNATKMEYRKANTFSDEFVVRKGKIYKCLGPKDDRLQVQIIPELLGLDEAEMDNLPRFPPFIKGTVITGKSIKVDGDAAEQVWVLCTPDFQVGYVLGKANSYGEGTKSKWPYSYNYSQVKKYLNARRALPEDFDYEHIDVVHWVATDKGGMVEMYNYLTGDWVLLNTSGAVITVQQKKIYIRVGTPANPPMMPTAFSAITITADKIHMKSPNIELDGQNVILAHHNLNLAGITPGVPGTCTNGINVIPIENVFV